MVAPYVPVPQSDVYRLHVSSVAVEIDRYGVFFLVAPFVSLRLPPCLWMKVINSYLALTDTGGNKKITASSAKSEIGEKRKQNPL